MRLSKPRVALMPAKRGIATSVHFSPPYITQVAVMPAKCGIATHASNDHFFRSRFVAVMPAKCGIATLYRGLSRKPTSPLVAVMPAKCGVATNHNTCFLSKVCLLQ